MKHHKKPLHKKVIEVLKKPIHKIVTPKRKHTAHKPVQSREVKTTSPEVASPEATLSEIPPSETTLPEQAKPADVDPDEEADSLPQTGIASQHAYSSGYKADDGYGGALDSQEEDESSAFWGIVLWGLFIVGLGIATYFVFHSRSH